MSSERRERLATALTQEEYANDPRTQWFKQAYDAYAALSEDIEAGSPTAGDDQIILRIGKHDYPISVISIEVVDQVLTMLDGIMEVVAQDVGPCF